MKAQNPTSYQTLRHWLEAHAGGQPVGFLPPDSRIIRAELDRDSDKARITRATLTCQPTEDAPYIQWQFDLKVTIYDLTQESVARMAVWAEDASVDEWHSWGSSRLGASAPQPPLHRWPIGAERWDVDDVKALFRDAAYHNNQLAERVQDRSIYRRWSEYAKLRGLGLGIDMGQGAPTHIMQQWMHEEWEDGESTEAKLIKATVLPPDDWQQTVRNLINEYVGELAYTYVGQDQDSVTLGLNLYSRIDSRKGMQYQTFRLVTI